MALFDIYQVINTQRVEGQTVQNAYFYQQTSAVGAPDASDMSAAFQGQMLPSIRAIQESDLVLHTEIRVINLFNPSDVDVAVISLAGLGAFGTQPLPIFNSVGFRLQQDNGAVKNGSKRYCGLDEAVQDRGVLTSAGYITALTALGNVLNDVLLHGVIPTFVPIIVKRLLIGDDYVLPDNLGDAVFGTVVDAEFDPLITSQVSRKVGVGI